MFKRHHKLSKSHSFFLFGPRSTGKTTLLETSYSADEVIWVNLLNTKTESLLRRNPEHLEGLIKASPIEQARFVIIDEVQKIPPLLDVVQRLMTERKYRFILTGSSARKLRRGSANLLGGRAFRFECFPLTHLEMADEFDLNRTLRFGALPEVLALPTDEKILFLRSYVETYFKEEVVAEQLVRNLIPFKNFLEIASQSNGTILNISNVAKAVGVDHSTVQNYYSILEDTMLAFFLPPYHRSIRQRQHSKAKFYYFDLGVQRALSGLLEFELAEQSHDFGKAFEHFIICEIHRLVRYKKPDWKLFYLRSGDDAEIDLVIERPRQKLLLIEIKSTDDHYSLNAQKLRGFKTLSAAVPNAETFLISRDPTELKDGQVTYIHWRQFISRIGLAGI